MTSAKTHITSLVNKWIKDNPTQFDIFKDAVKMKRAMAKDKFASAHMEGSDMRGAFEMPDELHTMLIINLSEEEMSWFKRGGSLGHDGSNWFMTKFPDFTLADTI